ncbi:hypothetical protein STENM327S_03505 [Streptomyces tendae]
MGMQMRVNGTRTGAIVVAAIMGSVVLSGCGGGDESDAKGGDESPSAGGSAGAREQGTAEVRAAYDKTAEAESARMTIRMKLATEGRTIRPTARGSWTWRRGTAS